MGIQDRDYYREWLKERHTQKNHPKKYRKPNSTVIVKANKANIALILILIIATSVLTFTTTLLVLMISPEKLTAPYLFLKNLFDI